jgi:hypothetical protein
MNNKKVCFILSGLITMLFSTSAFAEEKVITYSDLTGTFNEGLPVGEPFKIKITPSNKKNLKNIVIKSYGFPFNDNRFKLLTIEKNKDNISKILKSGYIEQNYYTQLLETTKELISISQDKKIVGYKERKIELKLLSNDKNNTKTVTIILGELLDNLKNIQDKKIDKLELKEKLELFYNEESIEFELKNLLENILSKLETIISIEEKLTLVNKHEDENKLCGRDVICSSIEYKVSDTEKKEIFEIQHPRIYFNRDYVFSVDYYYSIDKIWLKQQIDTVIKSIKTDGDNESSIINMLQNVKLDINLDNKNEEDTKNLLDLIDNTNKTIIYNYYKINRNKEKLFNFLDDAKNWSTVKIFLSSANVPISLKENKINISTNDILTNESDFLFFIKKFKAVKNNIDFINNYVKYSISFEEKQNRFFEVLLFLLNDINREESEENKKVNSSKISKYIQILNKYHNILESISITDISKENREKIISLINKNRKKLFDYNKQNEVDTELSKLDLFDDFKEDFITKFKELESNLKFEDKTPEEIFEYISKRKLDEVVKSISNDNNLKNISTSSVSFARIPQVVSKDYANLISSEIGFTYIEGLKEFRPFTSLNFKINSVDFDDPLLSKGLLKDPIHKMGEFSLSLGLTSELDKSKYTSVLDVFGVSQGYFAGLGYRPYFLPMMRFQVGKMWYKEKILNPLLSQKDSLINDNYVSIGFTFDIFSQLRNALGDLNKKSEENTN